MLVISEVKLTRNDPMTSNSKTKYCAVLIVQQCRTDDG